MPDLRFDGDILPDSTWGICKIHSPASVIRLVDEQGRPTANGLCQMCWEESKDDAYFCCPIHGIVRRAPGHDGCPYKIEVNKQWVDCLGKSPGPTEAEIAREAESHNRIWPGGDPTHKDAVDAPAARPPVERGGEAGESVEGQAGPVLRDDGRGVEDGLARRDSLVKLRQEPEKAVEYIVGTDPSWRDPFLEP